MSIWSLVSALTLVTIALGISRNQRLGLEKEIINGTVRALIQLMIMGYVLNYIFKLNNWKSTTVLLMFMILVAGNNAAKRGKNIPNAFRIVTFSIACGTAITIAIMLILKIITYRPSDIIPIGGMIIGNAMVASGLILNRLKGDIDAKKGEITQMLALGATSRQAVDKVLRDSLKAGMIPTIDSMKTLGIVHLPGMMTGLIIAGTSPLVAIRYQLVVAFMLSSTVAITCSLVGILTYRQFFTQAHQLKEY